MENNQSWMIRTLVIGGVVGALVGLGAAYILVKRSEETGENPQITPGEGVQLGLGVLGLLRLISSSDR